MRRLCLALVALPCLSSSVPVQPATRAHACVRVCMRAQLGLQGINVDGEDAGTIYRDPELLMEVWGWTA